MADIRRLDEATVERIAAGEVVERPASVVKELVENSLDADASRVEVAVESGGKEGIRVADDGIGMTESEVRRAVEEHTTSKIRDIDDLEAGVGTLGFRGEALHAVGAVSRVTIRTRPRSDRDVEDPRGTELVVEGGEVTSVGPVGCPEGTTIEVDDLFYNVPARRKYLKQDGTEFAHVNTVVTGYALANPDVAVSLTHDGRETFATTGGGDRREAVMAVYGREVAEAMVEVDAGSGGGSGDSIGGSTGGDAETTETDGDDFPDGPLDGVSGLVSHPETTRASREYLATYVNGRYVTANTVRDAVVEAYDTQLAPDRYPFAVLFLDVPAGDVDVNVHPRKLDVRFADDEGVREQIRAAVERALLDAGLLRSGAPRGKSAPEQTEIAPDRGGETADTDRSAGVDADATTTSTSDGSTDAAADGVGASENERTSGTDEASGVAEKTAATSDRSAESNPSTEGGSESQPPSTDGATESQASTEGTTDTLRSSTDRATGHTTENSHGTGAGSEQRDQGAVTGSRSRRNEENAARKFSGGHDQTRLGGEGGDSTVDDTATARTESFDSLPSMRVLGQFQDTYVVAETADGLVLVDQHAADERINYERLRDRFAGDVTTQALADPVTVSLTAREAELFEEFADALATIGFRAERTGERSVDVRTVPSLVAEVADPELLQDVLGAFVRGDGAAADTVEAAADELLADLACYPSITGNTSLTEGSVRELLATLDDCENPWACPHGRPVVVEFDTDEIEARFERDYPGHAGRRE
jgi:DNA mismatch repair protein MutL